MTLTPEQIAEGWKLHDGSDVCPIKDERTRHQVMIHGGVTSNTVAKASEWNWQGKVAYRIIEAHGADAAPARPTPYPNGYDELVFDADGMSQPFFTGGVWPEWLPDDAPWQARSGGDFWESKGWFAGEFAIRVRRREPKRETVKCFVTITEIGTKLPFCGGLATIEKVDGFADLSTLKIAEDAL